MNIIPYEEKYRERVRQICIETGSKDNLVNPEHRKFTLLMYCDPYLDHGVAFLCMDEKDVQGYILCTEDIYEFEKHFVPYRDRMMRECPHFLNRIDLSIYEKYADRFPAHLHIDIEENCTGKGTGTELMRTLITHLEEEQVKGLMVGVDRHNERAYAFYKKCGFMVLEEDADSAVLGMVLV